MRLRGYRCQCNDRHYQEAHYYVSVADGNRVILALGPFQEHDDALSNVASINKLVQERYNPEGRAWFYAFGTTAMPSSYATPGKLNGELS